MKSIKKALRLICFGLIMLLASIGLGFSAAILPSWKRQETTEPSIELVESSTEDKDENENEEKP